MLMDIDTNINKAPTFSEFWRNKFGTDFVLEEERRNFDKPGSEKLQNTEKEYIDYLRKDCAPFKKYMSQVRQCARQDASDDAISDILDLNPDLTIEKIRAMYPAGINKLAEYNWGGVEEMLSKSPAIWNFQQRIIGLKYDWETGKLVGYEKGITWANCWEKPQPADKHMITNAQNWFEINLVTNYVRDNYYKIFKKELYDLIYDRRLSF